MLFKGASARFLELHINGWKNEKHRQQWQNSSNAWGAAHLSDRWRGHHGSPGADMDEKARDGASSKAAH
jgi:hypothetical protein